MLKSTRIAAGCQRGVGLVELMVGMTVGLLIVAAATSVYITTLRGGTDTLRSAKLNMELRSAMSLMTSEIRRAGYWPAGGASLTGNPFTQSGANLSNPSGCLLFSYDKNANGAADASEYIGFKLNAGKAIQMRYSGSNIMSTDCSLGSWESLTDPETVVVDTLTFNVEYQCLNAKAGTSADEPCASGQTFYDAAASAAGKVDLVELRTVTIALTAHHINDAATQIQLSQSVFLRNSRIQTVGL